jgi:hypothetical protein
VTANEPLGTVLLLLPLRESLRGEDSYRDGAKGVSNLYAPGTVTKIACRRYAYLGASARNNKGYGYYLLDRQFIGSRRDLQHIVILCVHDHWRDSSDKAGLSEQKAKQSELWDSRCKL